MKAFIWVLLVAIAIGAIRVAGEHGQIFRELAHCWVAFLIAGAVYVPNRKWVFVSQVVLLSVLETICFFYLKH